jgi:hypothetical protein
VAQVLAFSTILFGATAAVPAHAYLDPGTGSMMLQLLMGGVVGALVVGKLYMQRAREFLRSVGRRIRAG